MSRICKLILAALVAVSFTMVAGSAFAQSGPKVSGNVAMGFGTITITPPLAGAPDIEGYTAAMENNLFVQGNNGPMNYRFRLRMRGTEVPAAAGGPGNSLADGHLQTVRGYVGWAVTDAFKITLRKAGTSPVASIAENDPVQNLSYSFTGDLADREHIDFAFKAGGNTFGATLSAQTPTAQSTSGAVSSSSEGDHENLNIELYTKLKFGGIGVNLKLNTASGTQYEDSTTTTAGSCTALPCTASDFDSTTTSTGAGAGNSYDSDGLQAHVTVPAGPATIKFDFETNTSDVRESDTLKGEWTFDYIGLLVSVAGLNIGFATEESEVTVSSGTSGTTETHINVHYRIPTGKGGWVGPELSMKTTADDTPNSTAPDEEITTIRWLQVIKF